MRATFIPAAMSLDKASMVCVLGPMVQMNFVCTAPRAGAKAPSCLKLMERLFSRAEPAPPLLPRTKSFSCYSDMLKNDC